MAAKITLSVARKHPALDIHRSGIPQEKLVYIAVANKAVHYGRGNSRIVYVGTTKRGIDRITSSGAARAKELFEKPGFEQIRFFAVYSKRGRQGTEWWKKLEADLVEAFFQTYRERPIFNDKEPSRKDHFKFFKRDRILSIIEEFS